jgi:prepilin-type N-terminal cleavage/methylation domain-containing protein
MKLIKKLMNQKGFTLVELLIVIAVIGILAVAVLTAINPIEQLKKSRDAGKLADARELFNGIQRYAAAQPCYPWESTAAAHDCLNRASNISGAVCAWTANFGAGMCNDLITTGEMKASFATKTTVLNNIFVTESATGVVSVCFEPESTAGRGGSLTGATRNITNSAAAACSGNYVGDATGTCFACI